jgi:hypothetical protein
MSQRPTLAEIRRELLVELALYGRTWRATSELHRAISNSGNEWYKTALVLERLASDGEIERKVKGRVRRFRRRRAAVGKPAAPARAEPAAIDTSNPFLAARPARVHPPPRDLDHHHEGGTT